MQKTTCILTSDNIPSAGPNVAKNRTAEIVTGHVDIAPTMLTLAGADMSADEIDVNLDGTPITFPLEDTKDFERNDAARGETTHLEYWGYV